MRGLGRVVAVLAGLSAGALVMTGCSAEPASDSLASGAPTTAVATPTRQADCLAAPILAAIGLPAVEGEATDAPTPGAVPADFVPVAAVRCAPGEPLRDTEGEWSSVTSTRLEGDMADLVAALDRPSSVDPARCVVPEPASLWLVDALDKAVLVAVPLSGCGQWDPRVDTAIAALSTAEELTFPVALTHPR